MLGSFVGKHRRNRTFLYCLLTVILFTIVSLLQLISKDSIDWSYYLAQSVALILGSLHCLLVYRYMPFLKANEFWKGFGITILIGFLAAIASAIAYYLLHLHYFFLTFIFTFVLPYACWQTYLLYFQIPRKQFKLWYYPVGVEMPDLSTIDLSQIQVIAFIFYKKLDDASQTNFTARAPSNMNLGLLFFIFINDYNEKNPHDTISYLNGQNMPFGWLFYQRKGLFKRKHYFDPDATFRENEILQNGFIYSSRYNVK